MITALALAAAVAVLVWPSAKIAAPYVSGIGIAKAPAPAPAPAHVSYLLSLQSLQTIRSRLLAAGPMPDDINAAIDALTLALVHGSDLP